MWKRNSIDQTKELETEPVPSGTVCRPLQSGPAYSRVLSSRPIAFLRSVRKHSIAALYERAAERT